MLESLEKNSSAIGNTLKFIGKHKVPVAATLGGIALAGIVAKPLMTAYYILNENNKKGIMNNQTQILNKIETAVNKTNEVKKQNPYTIPLVQPLV